MRPRQRLVALFILLLLVLVPIASAAVLFTTGTPDGRLGMASRPASPGKIEIEAADDFFIGGAGAEITGATFTGLIVQTTGAPVIGNVVVELYNIFPADSNTARTIQVVTRTNSPSDVDFLSGDAASGTLTFTVATLAPTFTAANSVLNGINKSPNQTTGGEGPVSGTEVQFTINFSTPFFLPAGHYFFIPQVQVSGGEFYWLSTARPTTGTPFPAGITDLQAWIRNANLDPDWSRVGTDIIGGAATFNAAFSLIGFDPDVFQVKTASNLNIGDSVINITNAGTANGPEGALQNICANVYTFSPDEQLISCCSCVVTPNALVSLSANSDLVSNTLTPAHPTSIVVKIVASSAAGCNAANVPTANLASGLRAWGTTLHALPTTPATFGLTETRFSPAVLSTGELARITSFCGFIQANGSGFGICRSCRLGGQGAVSQ
jgi:hypothetical protein